MRKSRIKAKLSRNEPALCTCLHLTDPSLYELVSTMGFDGIWMDMEHHGYSVETAAQLMRAARTGPADIVARPAKGEFMRMGRMLEMGAQAIMYPRCDGPEEAAEVVRWARFAPQGTRGFDGGNADGMYTLLPAQEYLAEANRETIVIIQLEHQGAVDRAEEIAALPGVDALMLGPADFSILSGFPFQFDHPHVIKAFEKIAAAARNTGKHWARIVGTPDQARQAIDMGARIIFHNADIVILKNAWAKIKDDFGPVGFSFGA